MRPFVLWPFMQRRPRSLIAFGIFRKPCQQRQDDDAEDGKKDHFPDDVQQKRHWGPLRLGVAVCRSSITADYTADPRQESTAARLVL